TRKHRPQCWDGLATPVPFTLPCSGTSSVCSCSRRLHEEAEGFFPYRTADRRGDHFDHRGDRYPQPAALEDRGQRILCGGFGAYDRHGRSHLFLVLGNGLLG